MDLIVLEGSPHLELQKKHHEISAMPDHADKQNDIVLYNAFNTIFSAVRKNADMRKFACELFKKSELCMLLLLLLPPPTAAAKCVFACACVLSRRVLLGQGKAT